MQFKQALVLRAVTATAILAAATALTPSRAHASVSLTLNDYAFTAKLVSLPAHLQVNSAGLSEYDKKAWSIETQDDGTELYTLKSKSQSKSKSKSKTKKKPEARAAIMRDKKGDLESMTAYELSDKLSGGDETAGAMIFETGRLRAFTSCETENSVGRVCVTATPDLCHALKAGNVRPEEMKQMETYEMRALAILLTLRGTDHQLDNMVKSGNRLGLKTALQTTKGQLLALSKVVERESRRTASVASATAPLAVSAVVPPPAQTADDKLAETVLEKSLPRLKQACLDTRFN
jgi:hypothetical protein